MECALSDPRAWLGHSRTSVQQQAASEAGEKGGRGEAEEEDVDEAGAAGEEVVLGTGP